MVIELSITQVLKKCINRENAYELWGQQLLDGRAPGS